MTTTEDYQGPTPHRSTMTHEQREMCAMALLNGVIASKGDVKAAAIRIANLTDPELHEAWLKCCRDGDW